MKEPNEQHRRNLQDFVVVCFGSHWQASGTIMAVLALAAIPTALVTFVQPALVAVGRTRLVVVENFGVLVLSAIVALATVNFGVVAVAAGRTARSYLTAPFVLNMLRKGIGLPVGQSLRDARCSDLRYVPVDDCPAIYRRNHARTHPASATGNPQPSRKNAPEGLILG